MLQFDGSTRAEDLPLLLHLCAMNLGDPLVSVKKMRVGLRVSFKKVGEVDLVHVFFVDALGLKGCFLNFRQTLVGLNKNEILQVSVVNGSE